jgi:branched-chain amino acid transport system permease protein
MLELYLQVVVYGIYIGALYGLAAVGIALMFGVMDILQIAHGSIVMLGGYLCFWLFHFFGVDPLLALPLVAVVFFLVGIMLFKGVFAPVTRLPFDDKVKNSMLVAFGLILVLDNLSIMAFTGDIRTVSPWYQGLAVGLLGIRLPYVAIFGLALAAFLTIGLSLFLKKTYVGKSIRATAQNAEAAALSGVSVGRTYALATAIATALGAVAGVLVLLYSGVDPGIGMDWTLKALLVTVLAGTGNIGGIFVCGLFFGVLEGVGSIFVGPYKEVIGLVLFLGVLIWKPEGLFSKER